MNYKIAISAIFFFFALVELLRRRFLFKGETRAHDVILDVASALVLPTIIVPMVYLAGAFIAEWAFPGSKNQWADLHPLLMFGILLIADDLTQYWWHRLSHTLPWLYRLHRAHHSANYLSIRVVYRNNFIYYAFMPGIWFSAMLVYWGFAPVYAWYIIMKLTVIISAHSSVPWDEALYQNRITRPLMYLVERVISTPATHSAHHGRHATDPGTYYKGNYGNFLFFWDVLFGTAKITRKRPAEFGLENIEPANWFQELVWPFYRR